MVLVDNLKEYEFYFNSKKELIAIVNSCGILCTINVSKLLYEFVQNNIVGISNNFITDTIKNLATLYLVSLNTEYIVLDKDVLFNIDALGCLNNILIDCIGLVSTDTKKQLTKINF